MLPSEELLNALAAERERLEQYLSDWVRQVP